MECNLFGGRLSRTLPCALMVSLVGVVIDVGDTWLALETSIGQSGPAHRQGGEFL